MFAFAARWSERRPVDPAKSRRIRPGRCTMGTMSSSTGRKHGQEGSAGEAAAADPAPAVGKQPLVGAATSGGAAESSPGKRTRVEDATATIVQRTPSVM